MRPQTAWGGQGGANAKQFKPVSKEQQELLDDMRKGHAKAVVARPQTAATSTLADETRILNKLRVLEKIEQKIEDDLENFINKRGDQNKKDKKGVQVTKQMLLDCS